MRFRPGARLDPGQVSDRRGLAGGGGLAVGGGGLGARRGSSSTCCCSSSSGGSGGSTYGSLDGITQAQQPPSQSLGTSCQTGADANARQDCRILGDVNSVQKYWAGWFKAHGKSYTQAKTVFFTGSTSTGCGTATTDVGPFYCPVDKHVYIDLGFYEELHDRFGAQGGPFAEAYVIAHEYGHHAQDLLGDLQPGRLAGRGEPLGAHRAAGRLLRRRLGAQRRRDRVHRRASRNADIADGLDAAAAVGDDRIQQQTQGQVNPGDVDARLGGRAAEVVPARLSSAASRPVATPSPGRSS